jgi:hypothetical protein
MTPEQISSFHEEGCVLLKGALTKQVVKPLADHVHAELQRAKLVGTGRGASPIPKLPAFQQVTRLGQLIRVPDAQAPVLAKAMRPLVDGLRALTSITTQPAQLLVSLPLQGRWTLEALPWHVDVPSPSRRAIPGIQAFALLDDVAPRGGATLALARSHRLDEAARREVRELLRTKADLERGLAASGLSVVEMAGRAGDVYLMDMRLLHSPSINATKRVRMMATVRYLAT